MRRLHALLAPLAALALLALPRGARAQDLECDRGDREVRKLEFNGNRSFSDDDLSLRVVTSASSWWRRTVKLGGTKRCLDSNQLKLDVYRLRLFYRNAGFYDAQVDTTVTPAGKDAVRVTFVVDEGKPIVIDSLAIVGLDSVPSRERITRNLWVARGKPFDQGRLQADADTMVVRLRNAGFPGASVLANNYEIFRDSLKAIVTLVVIPGARAHFGPVVIDVTPVDSAGHQEISDQSVRRLMGLKPGEWYSDRKIVQAQRNIYQTGAYRHVDITPSIDTTIGPDSMPIVRDTVVTLRVRLLEDYMREVNTEIGWATLDCGRVRAQLVDKDFLGAARRLELTGQLSKIGYGHPTKSSVGRDVLCGTLRRDAAAFSDTLNYYLGATIRQPTLLGPDATPTLTLYRERRSEFQAYLRQTLIGGELSLSRNLGRLTTPFRVAYTVEYGRTSAQPAVLCALFQRCDRPSQLEVTGDAKPIAVASTAIARVRTDNAIAPRRGSVIRVELRGSDRLLGSTPSLRFAKALGDAAFYFPGGWSNVLALRLRGGIVFGGTRTATGEINPPPPQERLYAGGAGSVRGFQQNELGSLLYSVKGYQTYLGPGDSLYYLATDPATGDAAYGIYRTVPAGGNTLVIGNLEYRVRDPFLPDLLQYTFFTDAGNVWTRGTPKGVFGFKTLAWTPGVGLRVFSPLGPIQVNVGYNPRGLGAGPAYYETPVKQNLEAPLYCVSPLADDPSRGIPVSSGGVQADASCPATYRPPAPKHWFNRLTFTFSIGPDF